MTRGRYAALTAGAGAVVGTVMLWFFHAPVVPAVLGVVGSVALLLIRNPIASTGAEN
ncbi:MAG: hypothetical protein IVW54_11370 [Candidatus Binataceae bacterium]|nr:hypothetical protein [Candidatus Binataceae bacterium]